MSRLSPRRRRWVVDAALVLVSVAAWVTAHVAFAAQYGPGLAQAISGFACQILLSTGGICQLLCRGHSRGASYKLW